MRRVSRNGQRKGHYQFCGNHASAAGDGRRARQRLLFHDAVKIVKAWTQLADVGGAHYDGLGSSSLGQAVKEINDACEITGGVQDRLVAAFGQQKLLDTSGVSFETSLEHRCRSKKLDDYRSVVVVSPHTQSDAVTIGDLVDGHKAAEAANGKSSDRQRINALSVSEAAVRVNDWLLLTQQDNALSDYRTIVIDNPMGHILPTTFGTHIDAYTRTIARMARDRQ